MTNKYLRAFVIGSSCLVFLPFFFAVSNFDTEKFNFDYKWYTFLAPVAFGLLNLLTLIVAEKLKISNRNRFLYASIIAPTVVLISVALFKIYNYTMIDWIYHIIGIYALYFFVLNVVLYNLDIYV
jgi:hypothetical protein